MSERFNIPIQYRTGVYGMKDFEENLENVMELEYEEYGDIVTYKVPDYEDGRIITLYEIPKEELENNLRATYGDDARLKKITVNIKNKDMLLYIHYDNSTAAMQEIQQFALDNANAIIEKIDSVKDTVSRLFVEYFDDGEYMDFHVKIGTEAQKNELKKKNKRDKYIVDSCGDYPDENITGDNHTLKIMVSCADREEMNYFEFAVNTMTERIKEKAEQSINKADDFKLICVEYD